MGGKGAQAKKKIFFTKQAAMDEAAKKSEADGAPKGGKRRRKMTITKEDAPPPSKPLYGAKKGKAAVISNANANGHGLVFVLAWLYSPDAFGPLFCVCWCARICSGCAW